MKFTILHVPDCPNVAVIVGRVQAAVSLSTAEIETVELTTDEEARAFGMFGSPTLLIDGANHFTSGERASISCALTIPSIEQIRAHTTS